MDEVEHIVILQSHTGLPLPSLPGVEVAYAALKDIFTRPAHLASQPSSGISDRRGVDLPHLHVSAARSPSSSSSGPPEDEVQSGRVSWRGSGGHWFNWSPWYVSCSQY